MTPNYWADFWRYSIGVNVFPVDTRYRTSYQKWEDWQDRPIPDQQHEKWKKENAFAKGMAIITGKIWFREDKKDQYFVFIDLDNQKGIDEICQIFDVKTLEELSALTIVEKHKDDLSRAHIFIYSKHIFKKKSSDMKKYEKEIGENKIPSIEVKGLGSHGIAFCCPSPHKDGYNYEIDGTLEPGTFGKEIEDKLFEIYKKYNLLVDKNGQIPIKRLFENDFVVLEGHNRHEALLRVMESLIKRNKSILSLEQIKQIAYKWNQQHCIPPLDDKEFEKQWTDAQKFIEKRTNNKSDYPNQKENTLFKIVEHGLTSQGFYIDAKAGEIRYGYITVNGLIPKKSIIDIFPKKVVNYNNPLFPKISLIEIEFSNGLKVGPLNDVVDIINVLESKGHVLNKLKAPDALNSIISVLKERGLVETIDDVTTPGYYLIHNTIQRKDVTQITDIKKEDAIRCCEYLDHLAEYGWKNKNIFPTVLKWGLVAPFSFIIKYSSNSENWMPWLQLYGHGQTGKTTLGKLVLNIWNLDYKAYSLGFNHIDSVARFGNVVSRDTYPKLINEIGALSMNSFGKYTTIVEMIKHSIESSTVRGKYVDNSSHNNNYQEIPALNPMIFTSNHQPINDSGYNRRMESIHFSKNEKKEEEEQQQFKKLFEENRKYLSVLGNFAASYIADNPKVLLEISWREISKDMLRRFYQFAEKDIPKWIEYFEEQRDAVDESTEMTHFDLRAFLLNKINETFSRYSRFDGDQNMDNISLTLTSKLKYCLQNKLISFFHEINDDNILITVDIMKELKKGNLENVTSLKDIGILLNFKYNNKSFNGKKMRVLEGKLDNLVNFLEAEIR